MGSLAGKRAVVTGAASGIGRSSAIEFAAQGAAVVLGDIDARVHDVAATIRERGGVARGVTADVTDERAVRALCAVAVTDLGGLEVMFANAGIVGSIAPVVELTEHDWRRQWGVNVLGVFYCLKHAALHMVDHGGGAILLMASVAGLRAGGGPAHYSACAAAVINLALNAAVQLADTSVRVNVLCPGLVESGMTRPIFEAARAAGKEHLIGQLNPLRRAGRSEEIAAVAAFLVSDAASYLNGETVTVDGGLSASLPLVAGRL
jgi:NAD(P)-dependent dehydrogenase (short-subunit alcohol dehydrogenase family)